MADEQWITVKTIYCKQSKQEATLEFLVAHSPEHMPDQPPRILARRCSISKECVVKDDCNCHWTGTNPLYDPFDYV
jgi:hypothetical protein